MRSSSSLNTQTPRQPSTTSPSDISLPTLKPQKTEAFTSGEPNRCARYPLSGQTPSYLNQKSPIASTYAAIQLQSEVAWTATGVRTAHTADPYRVLVSCLLEVLLDTKANFNLPLRSPLPRRNLSRHPRQEKWLSTSIQFYTIWDTPSWISQS